MWLAIASDICDVEDGSNSSLVMSETAPGKVFKCAMRIEFFNGL